MARIVILASAILIACATVEDPVASTALRFEPRPAKEPGGAPTVIRIVLKVTGDEYRVVSAMPRTVPPQRTNVARQLDSVLRGDASLLRWVARASDGEQLATGHLLVPLIATSEYLDRSDPRQFRRDPPIPLASSAAQVDVPYDERLATLDLERLDPSPDAPYERWTGKRLRSVPVPRFTTTPGEPR